MTNEEIDSPEEQAEAERIRDVPRLQKLIADNCDPMDASPEDAVLIKACHRVVYSENYPNEH